MDEKISLLISNKEYKEAYELTLSIIKNLEVEEVENWIIYNDVLLNKGYDEEYSKEYINPLRTKLKEEFPKLEGYIEQIDLINKKILEIYKRIFNIENYFKNKDALAVLMTITNLHQVEVCEINEVLDEELNKIINEKENSVIYFNEISMKYNIYLTKIFESLNLILKKLLLQKLGQENVDEKYMFELKDNIYEELIVDISNLKEILDKYELLKRSYRVVNNSEEGSSNEAYIKDWWSRYNIAKIRRQRFDDLLLKKCYEEAKDENLKILKPKDLERFVELNENSFVIKFHLDSEEFKRNMKTELIDFERQVNFISFENYIGGKNFDKNVWIGKKEAKFTFFNMLDIRIALMAIANFYYLGEEFFKEKTGKHSISPVLIIERKKLESLIKFIVSTSFGRCVEELVIHELLDLYTFGNNDIWDLSYTPVIRYENKFIIVPFVNTNTNFGRTFISYMSKLNIHFKDGDLMEEYFKKLLSEHNFDVYNPEKSQLNFTTKEGHKGDIDVFAIKGNFIFCGQLKNKPMPLDIQEYTNYDRKLIKGLKQLKYVEEYISENPKKILEYYKIKDLSKYKVVRFYVSNSFYRSGECIDGIYTTDMSAIHTFFDKGKITFKSGNEIKTEMLHADKIVNEKEFEEFLKEPYFLRRDIYVDM